jgi:hypothetical protein
VRDAPAAVRAVRSAVTGPMSAKERATSLVAGTRLGLLLAALKEREDS